MSLTAFSQPSQQGNLKPIRIDSYVCFTESQAVSIAIYINESIVCDSIVFFYDKTLLNKDSILKVKEQIVMELEKQSEMCELIITEDKIYFRQLKADNMRLRKFLKIRNVIDIGLVAVIIILL